MQFRLYIIYCKYNRDLQRYFFIKNVIYFNGPDIFIITFKVLDIVSHVPLQCKILYSWNFQKYIYLNLTSLSSRLQSRAFCHGEMFYTLLPFQYDRQKPCGYQIFIKLNKKFQLFVKLLLGLWSVFWITQL